MLILGLLLSIAGCVFGVRWFSEHKFEYLDGVRPSQQLDQNFWLCMGFLCVGICLLLAGAL